MGIVLKATWPNTGRTATYWVPTSRIAAAYKAFPIAGQFRVELESLGTYSRRPKNVEHHINDY
jgi:hypothetical protein